MRARVMFSGAVAAMVLLAACGDDDNNDTAATDPPAATEAPAPTEAPAATAATTDGTATEGSAAAGGDICALATEIFELEDVPSPEQLEQYRALAPPEIADSVNLAADALIGAGGEPVALFNALGQDDVEAAIAEIDAFEEENCGIPHSEQNALAEGATRAVEDDATRVDVTATDFAFAIGPVSPGRTSFVLTNDGAEAHFMLVVKLAEGVTLEDAMAAEGEDGSIEAEWGTNIASAGDEEAVTLDVEPGNYALLCFLPTTDGTPHTELGMVQEFTVA